MTGRRIAVGILAPAPLGVLLLLTWSLALGPKRLRLDELWIMPLGYLGVTLVGYLIVGAQSILYALLMEYIINRRLQSDITVVGVSALLGAIAAGSVLLLFPRWDALFATVLLAIGAIVGTVVGHFLRRMYKRALDAPRPRAPRCER
jgi:hypothetical protein